VLDCYPSVSNHSSFVILATALNLCCQRHLFQLSQHCQTTIVRLVVCTEYVSWRLVLWRKYLFNPKRPKKRFFSFKSSNCTQTICRVMRVISAMNRSRHFVDWCNAKKKLEFVRPSVLCCRSINRRNCSFGFEWDGGEIDFHCRWISSWKGIRRRHDRLVSDCRNASNEELD
jgi:hypothetical protein